MTSAPTSAPKAEQNSTQAIASFANSLTSTMSMAIEEIVDINSNTQLLALNARIEAARAGASGAAFSVVAQEMQALSAKTAEVADRLAHSAKSSIGNLLELIGSNVRGGRLSDLALVNIDLVDRNLYERTCDVRWWATDSSLVDALTSGEPSDFEYAARRMGVILSAYTVYHDLVLCDLNGRIVANGRPGQYKSVGRNVADTGWFRSARNSRSGDEYGFESAHESTLVDGKNVLVYSCGVREAGRADGKILGVLGVIFNWHDFAQTILAQVPLAESERQATRCCLCDDRGFVLADSWGRQLRDTLKLPNLPEILRERKNFVLTKIDNQEVCIAHAQAPGFETYSTGWHSVIIQPVD
jgi:hypothetical protein